MCPPPKTATLSALTAITAQAKTARALFSTSWKTATALIATNTMTSLLTISTCWRTCGISTIRAILSQFSLAPVVNSVSASTILNSNKKPLTMKTCLYFLLLTWSINLKSLTPEKIWSLLSTRTAVLIAACLLNSSISLFAVSIIPICSQNTCISCSRLPLNIFPHASLLTLNPCPTLTPSNSKKKLKNISVRKIYSVCPSLKTLRRAYRFLSLKANSTLCPLTGSASTRWRFRVPNFPNANFFNWQLFPNAPALS